MSNLDLASCFALFSLNLCVLYAAYFFVYRPRCVRYFRLKIAVISLQLKQTVFAELGPEGLKDTKYQSLQKIMGWSIVNAELITPHGLALAALTNIRRINEWFEPFNTLRDMDVKTNPKIGLTLKSTFDQLESTFGWYLHVSSITGWAFFAFNGIRALYRYVVSRSRGVQNTMSQEMFRSFENLFDFKPQFFAEQSPDTSFVVV